MEANPPLLLVRPEVSQLGRQFDELVAILHDWDNYVIIVDETSTVQSRQTLTDGLEWLTRQAPSGVDVIQTTHRIVDTQRLVRALATDYFFFRVTLEADLDLLRNEFGTRVAEEARKLGIYQCLHYWLTPGGAARWYKWPNPEDWYVRIRTEPA